MPLHVASARAGLLNGVGVAPFMVITDGLDRHVSTVGPTSGQEEDKTPETVPTASGIEVTDGEANRRSLVLEDVSRPKSQKGHFGLGESRAGI